MNNEIRGRKQEDFSEKLKKYPKAILRSSIRFGKTKVGLMTIQENDKVLICYPRVVIKDSWLRDIKKFGVKSNNISYSTFASLHKINEKFDYIIVDEMHKLSAKNIESLFKIVDKRLLLITGTLKFTKKRYWRNKGIPIVVEYDLENAINDKLVKDYHIYIHRVSLDTIDRINYDKYTSTIDWAETNKLIAQEIPNNKLEVKKYEMIKTKYIGLRTNLLYNTNVTKEYAKKLIESLKDEKVLIFALRTEVADELSEKSFHSKSKKNTNVLEEFKLADKGHLSTVNVINEGITINHLNNIVCHTITSNTEDFQQKLGRGLQLGDVDDEKCNVHLICIINTMSENWTEEACKSLNQKKISYVFKDVIVDKITYIKNQHPDKELYLYEGSFCYKVDKSKDTQFQEYKFLGDKIDRSYSLSKDRLQKL